MLQLRAVESPKELIVQVVLADCQVLFQAFQIYRIGLLTTHFGVQRYE